MTYAKRLKIAGCWSIFFAVSMVMSALLFVSGFPWHFDFNPALVNIIKLAVGLIATIGIIYIITVFKELLNKKAGFHGVDVIIFVTIGFLLLRYFSRIVFVVVTNATVIIPYLSYVIYSLVGAVVAIFGIKLLSCPDNLFGHLKPLAILNIIFGFTLIRPFFLLALDTIHINSLLALLFSFILLFLSINIFSALVFFKAYAEVSKRKRSVEEAV